MFCTNCGTQITETSNFCNNCGNSINGPQRTVGQIEDEFKYIIPMGAHPTAIIAGYLGLFSVLIVPAPFALIFGVVGLKQLKKQDKPIGYSRCWTGIILGSIFTALPIVLYLSA